MIMFLFETSVPKSEIDRVSSFVNNVCNLLTTVDTMMRDLNLVKNRMDTMEDHMSALERAGGFGGGGGGPGGGAAAKREAEQKCKRDAVALRGEHMTPSKRSLERRWTHLEG